MKKPIWKIRPALGVIIVALLGLGLVPAASVYYSAAGGAMCARCHEIRPAVAAWEHSSHRDVACQECHGGLLTFDVSFHLNNLSQLVKHLRGEIPQRVQLKASQLPDMTQRCRQCHEQEYAEWKSGPHATTYADILLDEEHNRSRLLNDNCFRCHGMHYPGGIKNLVEPVSLEGPWRMVDEAWADQPMIPCMACHQIHTEGDPLPPRVDRAAVREAIASATATPSLALYDRRAEMHIAANQLPLPPMQGPAGLLTVSPDPRQSVCYQCHAPLSNFEAGSADDRTGMGVHEGISCLACHQGHRQSARASCKTCHPALSNCGLDVETMDTTFRSPDSEHNIHFVSCEDCHPQGVPAPRDSRRL